MRRWFIRIKTHYPVEAHLRFDRLSVMGARALRRFYQRKYGKGAEVYIKPFAPEAQEGAT